MSTLNQRTASFPSIEVLERDFKTVAERIRHLRSLQETEDRGAIAKHLGIRYQWVRNVLLTPVKGKVQEVQEDNNQLDLFETTED